MANVFVIKSYLKPIYRKGERKASMNILAIGPHPDDIDFGCGGALIQYAKNGENVYLLVITNGQFGGNPAVRKKEQERCAKFIGAKKLFWGGFVDTEVVDGRKLIDKIETVIHATRPDMVLVNYLEDTHQDHRATSYATVSASRNIQKVIFYESPTSQNFHPDIFF